MKRSTKFRNQRNTHAIFELSLSKTSVGLKRGKGLDVDRNDAERIDRLLAPLAMQVLECPGTVGGYVQPLVFLVDPEAGLIGMKGRRVRRCSLAATSHGSSAS